MSTKLDDAIVLTDLVASFQRAHATLTELIAEVRGGAYNNVLVTELAVLDANGIWTKDWSVSFGSLGVANHGTHDITVTTGSEQAAAPPNGGPGIAKIKAGAAATVNMTGKAVTIYGTAGDLVSVTVFTKPQPPAWGLTTTSSTDELPGTFANGDAITVDNTAGGKLLLAASSSRRLAIVQNIHATAPFMLGLTGVDADTGVMILYPGQVARLTTTQALYGFRTTATSSTAMATGVT